MTITIFQPLFLHLTDFKPQYRDFRDGYVRHFFADVKKARLILGYEPTYSLHERLVEVIDWHLSILKKDSHGLVN